MAQGRLKTPEPLQTVRQLPCRGILHAPKLDIDIPASDPQSTTSSSSYLRLSQTQDLDRLRITCRPLNEGCGKGIQPQADLSEGRFTQHLRKELLHGTEPMRLCSEAEMCQVITWLEPHEDTSPMDLLVINSAKSSRQSRFASKKPEVWGHPTSPRPSTPADLPRSSPTTPQNKTTRPSEELKRAAMISNVHWKDIFFLSQTSRRTRPSSSSMKSNEIL